jgi:cell shape-determining protein MreD
MVDRTFWRWSLFIVFGLEDADALTVSAVSLRPCVSVWFIFMVVYMSAKKVLLPHLECSGSITD